ncbi:MAG: hypothetical protein ACUVX8_17490, partial [Candidatus Zipacnadales bacterium]
MTTSNHRAERALLTRARRGEIDALRGLLHRHGSVVWATCALVAPDETEAERLFAECWEAVFGSLNESQRSPNLMGLILQVCQERLRQSAPADRVNRAITSASHLVTDDTAFVEVPTAASDRVMQALPIYAEQLQRERDRRRSRRRRGLSIPALALALMMAGVAVTYFTYARTSNRDLLAQCLRERVVSTDLVSRLRDVVLPPFDV